LPDAVHAIEVLGGAEGPHDSWRGAEQAGEVLLDI
jgi:hypothetical protein